ncbi:hypothetical protein PoB_006355800 [Plakobranchus ocellatus]|uniref:Uncharacterized protein n=1 Tax=Plakobranchus ocellatus TaxID=259542 RepID=A0AAV4CYS1_9GAST|nr:hypothetical protein PoB_006355800 [Plakobranchus ocellatus]
MVGRMSLDACTGLMKSMWLVSFYIKDHPDEDFIADVTAQMSEVLARVNAPGDETFEFYFDMFVLMGHKPMD